MSSGPSGRVASARSERGEIVVRRRDDGALELRVNGVFVMDTVETGTERRLARIALEAAIPPRRVVVGGLGLGFTVRELLTDARVEQVLVAEIEPVVVDWMRDGTLPGADVLTDPRVLVYVGDVRQLVAEAEPASLDGVLLDVDNGPGQLVHEQNAAVYGRPFLMWCRDRLRAGGVLSVWSAARAPDLEKDLRATFGGCRVERLAVDLQGREGHYWLLSAGGG